MKRTLLIFICLLFYHSAITSQLLEKEDDKFWGEVGVGMYNTDGGYDKYASDFCVKLLKKNTLYTFRVNGIWEPTLFNSNVTDNFSGMGLLIGTVMSDDYVQVAISGGLGYISGVMRGKLLYTDPPNGFFDITDGRHFEKVEFFAPSIPLQIDFLLKPSSHFGFGVSLFADLNFKRTIKGITFKIGLGEFR
jgi:hypothetical protein